MTKTVSVNNSSDFIESNIISSIGLNDFNSNKLTDNDIYIILSSVSRSVVRSKENTNNKNDAISTENIINDNRLSVLEQYSRQFISYILEEDFEYGMESKAHVLVKEQMKINAIATKDWLNKIYVDNFQNSEILIGILRVIARFDREEIYPIGETIALASLSHKEDIVQENAIRAFESWGGQSSLEILENVFVSSDWIKEYLLGVISDLREYVG